jgi:hypothetical protein
LNTSLLNLKNHLDESVHSNNLDEIENNESYMAYLKESEEKMLKLKNGHSRTKQFFLDINNEDLKRAQSRLLSAKLNECHSKTKCQNLNDFEEFNHDYMVDNLWDGSSRCSYHLKEEQEELESNSSSVSTDLNDNLIDNTLCAPNESKSKCSGSEFIQNNILNKNEEIDLSFLSVNNNPDINIVEDANENNLKNLIDDNFVSLMNINSNSLERPVNRTIENNKLSFFDLIDDGDEDDDENSSNLSSESILINEQAINKSNANEFFNLELISKAKCSDQAIKILMNTK